MFVADNDKKIKWYWYLDKKMHEVAATLEGEELDLTSIHESCIKIVQDKSELCKKIYYLGVGLFGTDEGGMGFLFGWLVRSIKKDQAWQLEHTEETLSEEETADHLATFLEKTAKMIRDKSGKDSLSGITPTLAGGHNGTDLFK